MIVDEAERALLSFEEAFSDGIHGCRRQCACGRIYYNPDHCWSWDDGELDRLAVDPNATAVNYAIGTISLDGNVYADACECWKDHARRLITWLRTYDEQIAEFLTLEKQRRQDAAGVAPTVGA